MQRRDGWGSWQHAWASLGLDVEGSDLNSCLEAGIVSGPLMRVMLGW